MNAPEHPLAEVIWHASRDDEGTISATGANIVARAILASDWLTSVKADVWDERDRARGQYLGPISGHYEDCYGYADCRCESHPNPYRAKVES